MSVENSIREKLQKAFSPSDLSVENKFRQACGPCGHARSSRPRHRGDAFPGAGRVEPFRGEEPVARHREVNAALKEELAGPVHALAIKALTPSEAAG